MSCRPLALGSTDQLGPGSEARNATVLGLNDVDKQKLEEARQLAMSMTSHPVAFGTIEHTEKAGELLGLLWQEVLRLQCDLKDAQADADRFRWLAERTVATGLSQWVHPFQFLANAVDERRKAENTWPNVRAEAPTPAPERTR